MQATLLLLFSVGWSSSASALPSACLSPKFDAAITAATDAYWRDFHEAAWWKAQLCQESHLNPDAVSPVGAQGLAQIMPATYSGIVQQLKWDSAITAFNPERAINAGAFYQGNSRRMWGAVGRTGAQRNQLGACSYNAGAGSCLKAQKACNNALLWDQISPCLRMITGQFARETLTYVSNITQFAGEIKGSR